MKRLLLIALGLFVVIALIFVIRMQSPEPAPDQASRPEPPAQTTKKETLPPLPRTTTPPAKPRTRPQTQTQTQPQPAPAPVVDLSWRNQPIPLKLSQPPFVRDKDNDTVLKTDVIQTANQINDPNQEPVEDVQILGSVVGAYRTIFRENPIAGTNEEVIGALTGKNEYNLVFIDPAHPAINEQGQLTDRWGTPYHFHPLSGQRMEIFSAGPDLQHGTSDDILLDEPTVIGDTGVPR